MDTSEIQRIAGLADREIDREIAEHFKLMVIEASHPETGESDYYHQIFGDRIVPVDQPWQHLRIPEYSADLRAALQLTERLNAAGSGAERHYNECLRVLADGADRTSLRDRAVAFVHTCRAGLIPAGAWT